MEKQSRTGKVSVAVIGKSGHAARLIDLIRKHPDARLACAYSPKPAPASEIPCTDDFGAVLAADAVVIASPTPTHADYLRRLRDYTGHILVEKPAVSRSEELAELRSWPESHKRLLRVNYNLLHSELFSELQSVLASPEFGDPVYLDVHVSYGPAYGAGYKNSWKSDRSKSLGPLESIGVHFIHLAQSLFGAALESGASISSVVQRTDDAVDTGSVRFKTERGVHVSIFHSHAAPFYYRVHLLGTNGYWEWNGVEATLRSPRETRGADGAFAPPPLVHKKLLDQAASTKESLSKAIDDFIQITKSDGRFDAAELELALSSMDPLLGLRS